MSVQTARKIFEGYTKKEMEKEKLTGDLKRMVGHPIDREYKDMLSTKLIRNYPITTYDITNLDYTFGPDLVGVRGDKARNKPSRVDTE